MRDTAAQTFSELDAKYSATGGATSKPKQVKIFDDDESDVDAHMDGDGLSQGDSDQDEGDEDDEDEEEEEDDEEREDEEAGDDDEEESEGEGDEDQEDGAGERHAMPAKSKPVSGPASALDPLAAIKASKAKDVEKGKAIKRQQVS